MLSGKFVLRIDPAMHRALKQEAKSQGESLNSVCLRRLQGFKNSNWSSIVDPILQKFSPLGIVLFGSAARGDATEKSDIDLLIVLPGEQKISRDLYQLWDQEFKKYEKYSPQFVHLPKTGDIFGSIWLETAIEGEILYDSHHDIKNMLIKIRQQIAEGIYIRKTSHGHSYWIQQEAHAK